MTEPSYRLVRSPRRAASAPVLDTAQRAVLEHPGGPLLVLAGPGTGKTTTLVETVVERAAHGVPVERMLMLTFSRRAAGELRDRVSARLGGTVREPVARTLHSYAFGVLRMAAVRESLPAPRLLTAAEQDVVIRSLLAHADPADWPPSLRPALRTTGFAAEVRDLMMRAVERGLDGPALAGLGRDRRREDWVAAGRLLAEYHGVTVLRDPGGYDPAELIQGALNALRDDPDLLAAERGRRRRLFVDEYQDTDPLQAQLLQLLATGADELVLVGDPDQSIYAFRGADESALREVDERYGGGKPVPVVALATCRRSGAVLLAATRRVAARLPGRAEHRVLTPAAGLPPGTLDVQVFRSPGEEAGYLAGVLRAAHLDGTPWPRMAVLVRSTGGTLGVLRRAMAVAGVPVRVRGADIPLAEQPAVALLLDLLAVAIDPACVDEELAERLLSGPLGRGDSVYLRRLRRVLRQQYPDEDTLLAPTLSDVKGVALLPPPVRGPVRRVAETLAAGRAAHADGADLEGVLWALWHACGLARRWESASRHGVAAVDRDLDAVLALVDEVARFTDRLAGASYPQLLDYVRDQQFSAEPQTAAAEPDAVAVLTAHASKGLEWDVVCIAGVQEGVWPDLRRRGSLLGAGDLVDATRGFPPVAASFATQLAEERRLFYVAATRARRRLVVTAVTGEDEQPARFLDELDPVEVERPLGRQVQGVHLPGLVAELRAAVCDPAHPQRAEAATELARLAAAGVPGAEPDDWWGVAALSTTAGTADPHRPVPISPSRVEGFLECELRALLLSLGVQEGERTAANLGTLVHDLAATAPESQTLEVFEEQLAARWAELDFGASWFADNERSRATTMLRRLVDWLRESRPTLDAVAVEREFGVEVGDAFLSGRVDRLERDQDGRFVVVDLKTGGTKAADVETNPQLGTYQLAVEHGAFGPGGERPGGAVLVQLGVGQKGAVVQAQPPITDAVDPQWARRAVDRVAARMRGAEFTAVVGRRCPRCDVRTSCPLQTGQVP